MAALWWAAKALAAALIEAIPPPVPTHTCIPFRDAILPLPAMRLAVLPIPIARQNVLPYAVARTSVRPIDCRAD